MARLASTLLVLALLGGTAAAFAITEELKLEESPITKPRIDKLFSPVSEASTGQAHVGFTLRRPDTIEVAILDSDGRVVRELARDLRVPAGPIAFGWDGRDETGAVVPDGPYNPRVRLDRTHRTIRLPSTIRVDTEAPRIALVRARPTVFSPDRDGRAEVVRVRYRIDDLGQPLLLVNGVQTARGRFRREGVVEWFGKRDGRPLPEGRYALQLRAQDPAGNVSPRTRPRVVRIRYVDLARRVVRVPAGGVGFRIGVATHAKTVRWLMNGRSGVSRGRALRLRAPARPGRYTLYVSANGRADRALVVVTGAR